MKENGLWTGCVTDFRALDAGRKKSWGWEPDFRALDLGRKKSRVREPIFHALDPKNEKSRVWEPIFRALDPSERERSLHNTEKQAMVGSGRRKMPRWTRKREKITPPWGCRNCCLSQNLPKTSCQPQDLPKSLKLPKKPEVTILFLI